MLTKHISNRLFITNNDPYLMVSVGFCLGFTPRNQGARLGWFS